MSEQERLVDALGRAIAERDAARVAGLLHPEVELRLYSDDEPIVGREAARAWYAHAFRTRPKFEGEATAVAQADGSLLMRGRLYWYDEHGGRDHPGEWRMTFRDGMIATITAGEQ